MTHLGVIDKVKLIGSWSMKRDYKYDFTTKAGENIVVCLSGRGDKDVQMVAKELGEDIA